MASLALDPAYRRVAVDEFLRMDFADAKAELVDGVILMMAGAASRHNLVSVNILISLGTKLRGTGCRPYGSDQAVATTPGTIRYPDVSVFCGAEAVPRTATQMLLGDPRVVIEVLSPSTAGNDQDVKLGEYKAMNGVDCILYVSPDDERVRQVERSGESWSDTWHPRGSDVAIASLGITLTADELFALD